MPKSSMIIYPERSIASAVFAKHAKMKSGNRRTDMMEIIGQIFLAIVLAVLLMAIVMGFFDG